MFQSNVLLANHEQAGVHEHLQRFDVCCAPDVAIGWFVDVEMGEGRILDVDQSVYDEFNVDAHGPGDPANLIWDAPLLSFDPTDEDASTIYDADGFDVSVGGLSSTITVDVPVLSNIDVLTPGDTPPSWSYWRAGNTTAAEPYAGTASTNWSDWQERMWFLLNMFRVAHVDDLIKSPPAGRSVDYLTSYSPVVRSRLNVD